MNDQDRQQSQNIEIDENLVNSINKMHEENLKRIHIYADQIKNISTRLESDLSYFLGSIKISDSKMMDLKKQDTHEKILEEKSNINQTISKTLDELHTKIKTIIEDLANINDDCYYRCKSLYEINFNPPKINCLKNSFSGKDYLYSFDESNSSLYKRFYGEDENLNEFVNDSKMSFLNSYSLLIKKITYQCNYISKNNFLEGGKKFEIYPIIKEPNDNNSYLNFIKDIDDILLKKFNIEKFEEERFESSELDTFIKNQISKIFNLKNIYFCLDNLFDDSKLDLSSNSSDIKFIKTKYDNNMTYIKTDLLYDSLAFAKKKNNNKNKLVLNRPIEEIKRKEYLLNSSQLTYLIDCISNINKERDLKMEDAIIKVIKFQLQYNENKIHRNILLDFLITTEKFFEFSILEIISYFPKIKEIIELYNFKIIKDLLCVQVGIVNYIDNRKNLILTGKRQKFVGEDLYSAIPKDWIAIGIKTEEKVIQKGWIRCYYSLGNLSSDEIKKKLNKIIVKGFEKEELNFKSNISLKIKNIEQNSSIIILDNVQFRILLMVNIKKEIFTKGSEVIFDNEKIKAISILLKILNK